MTAIKPIFYPPIERSKCIHCDERFDAFVGGVAWVGASKTFLICSNCIAIIPCLLTDMTELYAFKELKEKDLQKIVDASEKAQNALNYLNIFGKD